MASTYFRAGVGAVVRDEGRILVLRRNGARRWAWQLPQGGIKVGEEPRDALHRELAEETGLGRRQVRVEGATGWLAYELPPRYRSEKTGWGQVQRWYLCTLRGPRSQVKPDGVELVEAEWVTPRVLVARAAPFRRRLYEQLVEELGL